MIAYIEKLEALCAELTPKQSAAIINVLRGMYSSKEEHKLLTNLYLHYTKSSYVFEEDDDELVPIDDEDDENDDEAGIVDEPFGPITIKQEKKSWWNSILGVASILIICFLFICSPVNKQGIQYITTSQIIGGKTELERTEPLSEKLLFRNASEHFQTVIIVGYDSEAGLLWAKEGITEE